MAKTLATIISIMLFNIADSQMIIDSTYFSGLGKQDSLSYTFKPTTHFFYGVHPYNATIFKSLAIKYSSSFQLGVGISQQFAINPFDPYWNGSSPLSPMQRGPGFPNFVPSQSSPSFAIKNSSGTFYSFSAGSVDVGSINRGFRQIKILKPIGKSGR